MGRNLPPRRTFVTRPVRRPALGVQQNRVVTIMGEADYTGSTLTSSVFALTADGVATTTLTFTGTRNGGAMVGEGVTFGVERTAVSAANSLVAATSPIANDNAENATITVTVLDGNGNPLPGIPAASVVLAATGTGNTITQPAAATDKDGRTIAYLKTTVAETKTVSVTVCGLAVTDTASVVASGVPATVWFEEDWDYTDTANMQSDPNSWFDADRQSQPALSSITLDTGLTTPWGGTKALKLTFDDMSGSLPSGTEVELGKNIAFPDAAADQPKQVWVEFYIKFTSDWKTNFGAGEFDHKTFFLTQKDTGGGRYRWDLRIGNSTDADPGTVLVYPEEGSNYWLNTAANGSDSGRIGAETWFWDGNWHLCRLQLKASSGYQVTDAIKKMWVDGTLVANQSGFYTPGTADGGARPTSAEYFAYMPLGRNLSRPNQVQSFWFGRIRVYTSDPGWT